MPSQPTGEVPPVDGALPAGSAASWGAAPFAFYVHVPFCASRCGYCDFNTYTPPELQGSAGVDRATFAEHLVAEVTLARAILGGREVPVETVFVGGGTPTLLSPADLGSVLERVRAEFGLNAAAEITLEANPDSVDERSLSAMRGAGFNRVSFGMQSAVPHVLAVLDRTHTPGGALRAVELARRAGFDRISVDLIYGTPGESLADWEHTIDVALAADVGHISAYALIVEPGTRLAVAVRKGAIEALDDDLTADMYELADQRFSRAGLPWYELSNWSVPGQECRHNIGYWHSDDWWGVGPGAHSHVAGTRWWNVKHPSAYVQRIRAEQSPAVGREVLTTATRAVEDVMLRVRLAEGIPVAELDDTARAQVKSLVVDGLVSLEGGASTGTAPSAGTAPSIGTARREVDHDDARIVLTRAGRLLADAVVRRLVP